MTRYRDAAVALWGEAGAYCHDLYDQFRDAHLPDLPDELPIVIGITAYGHCIGLTRGCWEHGPRITIASERFKHGRRWADDVMIHEMLHAALMLRGVDHAHDGKPWYDAVQALSPAVLGRELEVRRGSDRKSVRVPNPRAGEDGQPKTVVRKVPVEGAIPHGHIARWPGAFRPDDYDWGQPIECPSY